MSSNLIDILQGQDAQLAKLAEDMNIDLQAMTDDERRVLLQVLEEMATSGDSETLNNLYYADYDEVPVDIDTFIEDEEYFGRGTDYGKLIYPFWRGELRKIFAPGSKYFEVCLSGDTEVKLLDGRTLTMEQMLLEQISGTDKFYVYSYDMRLNKVTVGTAHSIMPTGIKPVYRITLDNGESFKATDNHKVLMRDKSWKTVGELSVGDSLMPFNWTYDSKGYEQIIHPLKDGSSRSEPTHIMVKKWKYGGFAYNRKKKRTMHHRDFNKRNNDPRNLVATEHQAHIEYHSKVIGQRLRDSESELITQVENYNHKVVSIEYVGDEVVYDMQVDSEHNFGLQCGAFVHNCITGGIGLGKSTIAVIGLGYMLHKLLCLKNPQEYYGLTKSSVIGIAFFNITLD